VLSYSPPARIAASLISTSRAQSINSPGATSVVIVSRMVRVQSQADGRSSLLSALSSATPAVRRLP